MSEEQRQSWNLLESRSFDMHKNTVAPMIAILGCSEVDMEVSSASIETIKSNDYREVLENNKILMGYWLWYEREQDFPAKIDESLSTHLPSQLVDCVG